MAVGVNTSSTFEAVPAEPLFSDRRLERPYSMYDVAADGRFVLIDSAAGEDQGASSIRVTENWHEEFRGREYVKLIESTV